MAIHGGKFSERRGVQHCDYCGSLTPAHALKILSTPGSSWSGCDNKYGYPHKFYLTGEGVDHAKFYTDHLNDLSDVELATFAERSRRCFGVDVGRDEKGLWFRNPPRTSFYGWQTFGDVGPNGAPTFREGSPVPPDEAWFEEKRRQGAPDLVGA